jgi:hypothetical protein
VRTFGGRDVVGRRFRAGVLAAVTACAAVLVAGPPLSAHAASPITLGHDFGRIVVDPGSSEVFISSPADSSIIVLDLMGNIVKTITGESGANAMAVVGSTLYVSLETSGVIDRIDIPTLTETGALVSGLVQPGDIAYAGSKLWTTTGPCNAGPMKPVSIDLAAVTPTATIYDNVFTGTNGFQYCAKYATDHASNPSFLIAFGGLPYTYGYMDVSGSMPSITRTTPGGTNSNDVTVATDEAHFLDTAVDYCPTTNTYCFREYNVSDLSLDGITYPAQRFPIAVDTTSSNGAKVVGGISAANSIANSNLVAYPVGDPSQVIASANFGQFETNRRGVAISPDGLTAYVVASEGSCNLLACEQLNLVSLPAVPPNGAPSAPTGVSAFPGVGSAQVSWNAPPYHGKSPITGYLVQSSGGATAGVGPTTFNALIAGLSSVPHTFTVIAMNMQGNSPPSAPSSPVTPIAGGTFNTLSPARLLDTRNGIGGVPVGRLGAGSTLSFQVAGRGGVPATGLSAVALNVTVTSTSGTGFLTVYPAGASRPTASSLNWTAGRTVPNLVQIGVGTGGKVNFFVSSPAHLIVDVEGWYGDSTDSYFVSGLFHTQGSQRWYDSRYISTAMGGVHQPLGPGETRTLQFAGGYLPIPSDTSAIVLNVTVTSPTKAGYVTVFPAGAPRPNASSANFLAGQTVANRVIARVGQGGQISFFNSGGTIDIIVDVSGWFTGTGGGSGSPFVTGMPVRIFDSRSCACKLPGGYFYDFSFSGPPIAAMALNVTVTNPTTSGWLTVYVDDGTHHNSNVPNTSDVNFSPGQTVANATIIDLNGVMAFNVYNSNGYTDIIIDVDGLYLPAVSGLANVPSAAVHVKEPSRAPMMPGAQAPSRVYAPAG